MRFGYDSPPVAYPVTGGCFCFLTQHTNVLGGCHVGDQKHLASDRLFPGFGTGALRGVRPGKRLLRLIFLHVVEPPVYYGEVGVNFTVPIGDFEAEHARIGDLAKTITDVNVEPMAVEGVAATEIVRVARSEACDLIVIGSHGRDGLGRVLMGSVAEEVSRHSPCATLIVARRPFLNTQARPPRRPSAREPRGHGADDARDVRPARERAERDVRAASAIAKSP